MRVPQAVGGRFPLCQRCRDDRDAERAQKRQDAIDAAAIDEFAAKPDKVHRSSNLDMRRLALERQQAEAGALRGLLESASRPGAGFGAGMALVADERKTAPPVLIQPRAVQARRLRSPRPGRCATHQLPMYWATTAILECPISREILSLATLSSRFLTPCSVRLGGPPAAGDFQPVIAS